jgi:hypothetical protein
MDDVHNCLQRRQPDVTPIDIQLRHRGEQELRTNTSRALFLGAVFPCAATPCRIQVPRQAAAITSRVRR